MYITIILYLSGGARFSPNQTPTWTPFRSRARAGKIFLVYFVIFNNLLTLGIWHFQQNSRYLLCKIEREIVPLDLQRMNFVSLSFEITA